MTLDLYVAIILAVLGALIGSFSNVLIHRLPRKQSVAFPPSACPNCGHRLAPLDLVPILSWVALGRKCRYCGAPINGRYPLVELLTAGGYALLGVLFPFSQVGASVLLLCALFTLLLVISFIDAETFTVPDELVLPGVALGMLTGYVNDAAGATTSGLPSFQGAWQGALLGAGVLAVISLYGELVLRRFRERRHPEYPVSYQNVALALLVGAWVGPWWGIAAGVASVLLNLVVRRPVSLPESLVLLGFLVSMALSVSGFGPSIIDMCRDALLAAGGMSLLAAVYWWARSPKEDDVPEEELDPVAMGFGDVKLAAMIGAFVGWASMLVTLGFAVVAGAVLGVIFAALGRGNKLPFAPYLAVGALLTLFFGEEVLRAYLNYVGG
ncbi:prepilin peptidase [Deinococcus yavapaiensis]|uniref:Type 4 prepilin peptidase 1 n=1 Tax=Deinococcus yavapaiensis KR-236 TaxID=694435 RepID=A0A318S9G3_9DEIO|nr:A24 family peptidase [Deinococcus yavapaiensis]PYE55365.1 type 4 prepilin peptidase 1 [Deinococcus yavapaiensis KR-236]